MLSLSTSKTDWCLGLVIKELLSGADAIGLKYLIKKKKKTMLSPIKNLKPLLNHFI